MKPWRELIMVCAGCAVLLAMAGSQLPPSLPSNPRPIIKAQVGTITTNPVFAIEWGIRNLRSPVGIFDSSNLVDWRLLLELKSDVLTNLNIQINPARDQNRFFKWEILK